MFAISTISPAMAVAVSPKTIACANVLTIQTKNEAELATRIATMQTDFAARIAKINSDKTEVDKKIATNRANAKKSFEEKIQKLESQTGLTNTQKQAILIYKTNMQLAETTRETAVDSARSKYRTDLLNIVTTRQQTITEAVNTYQATIQSAFMTAKASCGNGITTTNMSSLRTAIMLARQKLTATKTESEIKSQIKKLATTRNDAIKLADNNFKESATIYKTTLSVALKTTEK